VRQPYLFGGEQIEFCPSKKLIEPKKIKGVKNILGLTII
jgi:hypothetical protein